MGPQLRIYYEIQTIEDNEFRWQEQVIKNYYFLLKLFYNIVIYKGIQYHLFDGTFYHFGKS